MPGFVRLRLAREVTVTVIHSNQTRTDETRARVKSA
jgi:hypothetical protein